FDLAAPGLTMLETSFGLCMRLVHDGHLTVPTLVERLTIGPVRAWGLDRRAGLEGIGTLAPGGIGDVALLDPNAAWTVDPAAFASKGKNTPLTGRELRGRVVATIFGGRLVHETDRVVAL
ncbi:MAG: dihydroorotase, partial [Dehalococcoidia bacterium]